MRTFDEAGVGARTLAALTRSSIHNPVTVQAESIPALLEGRDVVMEAPTGSGKTLAFLVPMVERFGHRHAPGPRGLIVAPTRELAIQIDKVLTGMDSGLRRALIYGGVGYATQTLALKQGVDVVVGTPGRILDMIGRKMLSLSRVEYLVLDEADEMLDQGFAPDVERILGLTYQPQTVLASATMPGWVTRMIELHLQDPLRVMVEPDEESLLEHGLVRVERGQKLSTLSHLLRNHGGAAIVFGRTKHGVKKLNRDLKMLGHNSVELQGNLSQSARDHTMAGFRNQRSTVLVATNVAARGLDISHVGLVINFELPDTPLWLTHRIGRTARMGQQGRALTFVAPEDQLAWHKLLRLGAPHLPEIDLDHLLHEGGWRYRDGHAPVAAAHRNGAIAVPGTTTAPSPGRRRRRRYRGGRPSNSPAA